MQLGEAYAFVPTAFGAELGGGGASLPRRVTGRIVYIHWAHRYFTVQVDAEWGHLRESFKF